MAGEGKSGGGEMRGWNSRSEEEDGVEGLMEL